MNDKVREELLNELQENAHVDIVRYSKKWKTIKQALEQPSIEELKQSIIDRLNEIDVTGYRGKWLFEEGGFKLKLEMDSYLMIFPIAREDSLTIDIYGLPLDLAHDIITYFMRLRSEKE